MTKDLASSTESSEIYLRISEDGRHVELRQLLDHPGNLSMSGKSKVLFSTKGNITIGTDSRHRDVVAGINIYAKS